MKTLLTRQWFMMALAVVLVVGFRFPDSLGGFASNFPVKALVASVLFLMAWTLDADSIKRAIRRPLAAFLGIAINLVLLPVFAWLFAFLLPRPFDLGLALVAAMPCTLASAAVWTRRAGGNDAVAMMVTTVTNVSCFVVTPLVYLLLTGVDTDTGQGPLEMIIKLTWVVVLPMSLGQALRLLPPAARWASDRKSLISSVAQIGILTMVLVGATRSSLEINGSASDGSLPATAWLVMIAVVALLHVVTLLAGFGLGKLVRLERADWIAVGIAGSQKTLMIGLYMGLDELQLGIGILPMVVYHAAQLLIDTAVADWLRRRTRSTEAVISTETGDLG